MALRLQHKAIIAAKALVHGVLLLPIAVLLWRAWQELQWANGALGADPIAEIEHVLGLWALRILCLALAVTPLARITRFSDALRFRRLIGLYAFAYASAHFCAYLFLDLGRYWSEVFADIVKRPFILVGFLAWLILLSLAVTSNQRAMRSLGRQWARLHRGVYVAAALAVLHFYWLVKSDIREPALYAAIVAGLLLIRVYWRYRGRSRITAVRKQSTP